MKQFLLSLLACVIGVGSVQAQATAYCIPPYTNGTGFGDYINSVQINTITNVTGANPAPYYTDYSATQSTQLLPNTTYTLSVQVGTFGSQTVAAWIDYNNDFLFDPTEKLGEVTGIAGNGFATITFTVPATALGSSILRVRDVYLATNMDPCASGSFGETEDYGVTFAPPIPDDAGVLAISLPGAACGLSATTPITITIQNYGTNTQTSIPVSYSINGGTAVNETYTGSIAPASSATYTFTATADLSLPGAYSITATTALNGDTNAFNDAKTNSTTNIIVVTSYPYLQDFEAGTGDWAAGGTASSWVWATPAKGIIIGAASGTQAWVTDDAVNYNPNENSFVLSPCFDFTSLVSPIFRAKIWWQADDFNDGAVLEVTSDGGTTWDAVGALGDPYNWYNGNVTALGNDGWTGADNTTGFPTNIPGSAGWMNIKHKLDTLGGKPSVRFRFRFASNGFTQADGFAFDDVEIVESPPIDAAADSVVVNSGCGMTSSEVIGIVIKNEGTQTLSNIPVYYEINGGGAYGPETATVTIAPGATALYSFIATANLSAFGPYTIDVWTGMPGDGDANNDKTSTVINVLPTITSYPYLEDYENGAGGWTTYAQTASPNSWQLGTPNKATILGAASGTQAWVTDTANNYSNNESSWVEGPCFNLSSLIKPIFRANVWWNSEFSWDGMVLQASTNGGTTWTNVGKFGDPNNWYTDNTVNGLQFLGSGTGINQDGWSGRQSSNNGSGAWVSVKHELNGLGGNPSVRLRLAFGSDGSVTDDGVAFDDVEIFDTPPFDAGVSAIIPPANACNVTGSDTIKAVVTNYGTQSFTLDTIKYQIDNGPVIAEATTLSLSPGTSGTYIFNTLTGLLAVPGQHIIVVWTDLNGDGDPSNDPDTLIYNNLGANGMTGTYTIDGSQPTAGTNYISFTDAILDLTLRGLCGPVVFNVAAGTYNEQLFLTPLINSSVANTVTFDGSGATTMPVLTYAPFATTERHIWRFDSVDNIVVKNLHLKVDMAGGATFGWGVHLINGAENIKLMDNIIETDTTATGTAYAGIVQNASNTFAGGTGALTGSNNQFVGNTIIGGYYGISSVAGANTPAKDMVIENNTIQKNYFYGVFANNQDAVALNGNKVTPRDGTNTSYGLYLTNCDSAIVWNNTLNNVRVYGIYLTGSSGSATAPTQVVNNMISDSTVFISSFNGGIYTTGTSDIAIYNNSIWAKGATANGINVQSSTFAPASRISVVNNAISTTGTDPAAAATTDYAALYIAMPSSIATANYNNLYSDNTDNYVYTDNNTTYYTSANFVGGAGFNANSKDGDPGYVSKSNLHSFSAQLYDAGDNSVGVVTDIDGQSRPAAGATNVCIGADEFTPPPFDAGVVSIFSPGTGCGLTALEDLVFSVKNSGTDTIFTMNIMYSLNGGAAATYVYNDTLATGKSDTIVVASALNLSTPGTYTLTVYTALVGDTTNYNDTLSTTIISIPTINTFPYAQGFETGSNGWFSGALSGSAGNSWVLATPAKTQIVGAAKGINAWVTNATGQYLNNERSFVSSPCFDFSTMVAPKIQLAINYFSESSQDGTVLQSSIDGGATWQNVGTVSTVNNWYNDNSIFGLNGIAPNQEGWTGNNGGFPALPGSGGWIIAKRDLTGLAGQASVRLRVLFGSTGFTTEDGFAFDDVFIYDTPQNDLGVTEITSPKTFSCGDSTTDVIVVIENFGLAPQTSFPITVDYTGTATGSLTTTYTGTLAPGATATVTVGTINTFAGGTYSFTAYTQLANDGLLINDTTKKNGVVINGIPSVGVTNAAVTQCAPGPVSFTGTSNSATANYNWYTVATGGAPVFTGSPFITPSLPVGTTTYYVEATTKTSAFVGAANNNIGGGGQQVSNSNWLIFTATQAFTIDSVTVYPAVTTGTVIVNLEDANGVNIASASYAIPATYTNAGDPLRIPVGINVPVGVDWQLTGDAGISLYRNSSGPAYPYTDPSGWVTITNSSAGTSFYYYFYNWLISSAGCASNRIPVTATIYGSLAVSLGPDQSICDTATVTAAVTGGAPQFNYAWSNSAISSSQQVTTGIYSVVVTDANGCTGADTVNIVSNPKPVITLPATSSGCGSDTLDAGNVGSSYVWTRGGVAAGTNQFLIAQQSGTYVVTVTNGFGCIGIDTTIVSLDTLPVVNLGGNKSVCGPTVLDAGNAGSTYVWNNNATTQSITASTSGLYSVTVTNSKGCTGTGSATLTFVAPPVSPFAKADTTACNSATLDAKNAGMTYLWSNNATTKTISVSQSGGYSVTITNSIGCKTTDTLLVTINTAPSAKYTLDGSKNPIFDFTNTSTGSLTGATYNWQVYQAGTTISVGAAATTANFSFDFSQAGAGSGIYDITLTVTNTCGTDTFTIRNREINTAMDANAFAGNISIYPNPTDGFFFVKASNMDEDVTMAIYDVNGKVVQQRVITRFDMGTEQRVDLSTEAKGVYMARFTTSNGASVTRRIVVK